MFDEESKFRTKSFSFLLMLEQILHLTIFIFPFGPHFGLDQGNLIAYQFCLFPI
jgi:hypothetical protein